MLTYTKSVHTCSSLEMAFACFHIKMLCWRTDAGSLSSDGSSIEMLIVWRRRRQSPSLKEQQHDRLFSKFVLVLGTRRENPGREDSPALPEIVVFEKREE